MISGTKSTWRPVTSGVPQGSIQGPILTHNIVNGPDDEIQCKIHKFEDDTKVGEEADKLEGFADGLLIDWKRADRNLVKFKQREEREEGLLCLGEHYL